MPTRRPWLSMRAPPELPGEIAASVWMRSTCGRPPVVEAGICQAHARDDALGHGVLESQRAADRQRRLAALRQILAERDSRQSLAVDPHDGEIGDVIRPRHLPGDLAAVGKRDLDLGSRADDVRVGDDHPVRLVDHTAAETLAGGDGHARRFQPGHDADDGFRRGSGGRGRRRRAGRRRGGGRMVRAAGHTHDQDQRRGETTPARTTFMCAPLRSPGA